MVFPPTRAAYEALINEVKLLNEENKQLRNEKKETGRSTLEVELEPETRDRKASRNAWAEIYHNNTVRRKSVKLLGQDVAMDEWLDWRVKWAQRGVGFFGLIAMMCLFAGGPTLEFCIIQLIFVGMLYYKNISYVIMKRLLREMNVVIIIILSVCNLCIEIARPITSTDSIAALLYMILVNGFVFLDAIKLKSRIFVIIAGCLFTLLNLYSIYGNTFGNWNKGVILFKYTIQGEENTVMKRSTQRSIFLQVLLFSMTAVYIMFKDKKMELMIFATGNIYRETGTASKHVEDKTFSMEIKREKKRSTNKVRV